MHYINSFSYRFYRKGNGGSGGRWLDLGGGGGKGGGVGGGERGGGGSTTGFCFICFFERLVFLEADLCK